MKPVCAELHLQDFILPSSGMGITIGGLCGQLNPKSFVSDAFFSYLSVKLPQIYELSSPDLNLPSP